MQETETARNTENKQDLQPPPTTITLGAIVNDYGLVRRKAAKRDGKERKDKSDEKNRGRVEEEEECLVYK
jgi:hypothetical protein